MMFPPLQNLCRMCMYYHRIFILFASQFAVRFAVPVSTDNVGCVQSAGDVVILSANAEMEKIEIKIAKQIVPICFMLGNNLFVCMCRFLRLSAVLPIFTQHILIAIFPFL